MPPTRPHYQIIEFLDVLRHTSGHVTLKTCDTELFEQYITDPETREKFDSHRLRRFERIRDRQGIGISEDQQFLFFAFSAHLQWQRIDTEGPEHPLRGGFALRSGGEIARAMKKPCKVLTASYQDFTKYEVPKPQDAALMEQLLWFDRMFPTAGSQYTGFNACVRPGDDTFPADFYFYDDGLPYALPFKTYADYIDAMVRNAAVECWQYFYIDPEEIITRNRGLSYMTTRLRVSTGLKEGLPVYELDPAFKYDRLDLIREYLGRCVRTLPLAFPEINFDHQAAYLDRFDAVMAQT